MKDTKKSDLYTFILDNISELGHIGPLSDEDFYDCYFEEALDNYTKKVIASTKFECINKINIMCNTAHVFEILDLTKIHAAINAELLN